ncbi:MAG TPA: MFS transporter [Parvibaculum sp.]|jgi:MFS family permease
MTVQESGARSPWWSKIDHRSTATLFFVALAGSYGMLFASMLPALVNNWLFYLHLSERTAGLIATANVLAATAGLGLSIFLLTRWSLVRIAQVGIAAAILGDVGSLVTSGPWELGFTRVIAGLGLGLLVGVTTNWFGRHEQAERGFGMSIMLQFVLTAVLFSAIPLIEPALGHTAVYVAMLSLGAIAACLSPLFNLNGGATPLPKEPPAQLAAVDEHPLRLKIYSIVAFAIFELAAVGLWSYMLRYAEVIGMSAADASNVLALSSLCGIPGTVLVVLLGSRCGRLAPLILSLVAYTAPTLLFALLHTSNAVFIAGLILQNIAWAVAAPYFQAVQSMLDKSGRLAIWGMLVASVGAGLGPALLGTAIHGTSYVEAFGVAAFALGFSMLIVLRPAFIADRLARNA